jgi:energy-converting hydrogenase A subunit R
MTASPRIDSPKIFISDCEGPISKNDNAFELTRYFIPQGDKLFTLISRYDDVLADIVKREDYKAGDTLKLILPFLKAYGVTNQKMVDFSSQNILLMPGAKEMLEFVQGFMPAYIVSTSYEQYMRVLCGVLGFPFANVRCTRLNLDKYSMGDDEKTKVKKLAERMINLPMLEIPTSAQSLDDLSEKTRNTLDRLDDIFWKEISNMNVGKMFLGVNPIGGSEKAAAVEDITTRLKGQFENVMYVGDSITDVQAFEIVRNAGGLTVSLNGNGYAVREAEVAVLAENAVVTAVLASLFSRFGKARLLTLIRDWKPSSIQRFGLSEPLQRCFEKICDRKLPIVKLVTESNKTRLMKESSRFRKNVRGEAVGKLG